jgi:hypothetical protein
MTYISLSILRMTSSFCVVWAISDTAYWIYARIVFHWCGKQCVLFGVRIFVLVGINGGVVHGLGFESFSFWGQWWCSAWSWVRILGVNGGVVHGLGFEFWLFGSQWQRIVLSVPNRRSHIEKQRLLSVALHTNNTRISCRCWSSFYVRLAYHLSLWAIRIFHTDTWYALTVLKVSIVTAK